MINETILHYTILDKLGEGGMGVVYKAEDTQLDRIVALKFMPPNITPDEAEHARFLQEAKAASSLNHPNVCTIYGIHEVGGKKFIEMEFVEGMTLRQKLPIASMTDALNYAVQAGNALHEAHQKGIVHRDIKADNIMINAKNQVKVMDFGLAKLKGSLRLTKTTSTVGTLAYMAPEQIQAGEVDGRSDIFSYAVVLYEMLAGRLPFRGDHDAALMYSILNEEPEPIQKHRPDLSPILMNLIQRALEKDPNDRYQSINEMVIELRRLQKQSSRVVRPVPSTVSGQAVGEKSGATYETGIQSEISTTGQRNKRKQRFVMLGAALVVLVAGAIGYYSFFGKQPAINSIAVLPFANVGNDPDTEYLSDGITETLINSLSQISNLTVMSRSSVFHYKGKELTPQQVGKELGVKAVLAGRVMQRGNNLQISTELVNVSDNSQLWGEMYNKKVADLLGVQEEISKEISQKLSLKLAGGDEEKLSKHSTKNTEAYQLFLKGRFHWNKRNVDDIYKAIDYFNEAIAKDPEYALAYAGLASSYILLPEYAGVPGREIYPKTEAAAKKASELDPSLAEPYAVLGLIKHHQWDWANADKEFRRAIELNPNYPTAHHWFSLSLRVRGKFEDALSEISRAKELDPLSLIINLNVAEVLWIGHRYDQAEEQMRKTLDLDPNFPGVRGSLGIIYAEQGKLDEAIVEIQKARQIVGAKSPFGLGELGYVYAKAGKKDEARNVLEQLLEFSKQGYSMSVPMAMVYTGLGEKARAFEWLENAYQEQNSQLVYLKTAPMWTDLRSDPRYTALVDKIGFDK